MKTITVTLTEEEADEAIGCIATHISDRCVTAAEYAMPQAIIDKLQAALDESAPRCCATCRFWTVKPYEHVDYGVPTEEHPADERGCARTVTAGGDHEREAATDEPPARQAFATGNDGWYSVLVTGPEFSCSEWQAKPDV